VFAIFTLLMKIKISDIPKEGLDLEFDEATASGSFTMPVRARLRVDRIDSEIVVRGELEVDLKFQCSRCLRDFSRSLTIPVDAVYHPVEELGAEERHEVMSEELDMDFYAGEELDVLNLLNEQIALHTPMKPLCSDECRGICPKCGADLNYENCKCTAGSIDPRFEPLKKLLK
jgi:uncharacterized protein